MLIIMSSVFNTIVRTLGNIHIFIWFLISSLTWFLLYTLYINFMRRFVRKMELSDMKGSCLIELIWLLCFNALSILLTVSSLNTSTAQLMFFSNTWIETLQNQMDDCKIRDDVSHRGIKTIFVLHTSFNVLQAIHTWYYKGLKNTEFFQKQSIFTAYLITYFSSCSHLGMTILLLASRTTLLELISQFLTLIGYITKSKYVGVVAKVVCFYHICIWTETYLWTFPVFLSSNKTITSSMTNAKLYILITLDVIIWLYVLVSVYNSIFTRAVSSLTFPSTDCCFTFEYCLFGRNDLRIDARRRVRYRRRVRIVEPPYHELYTHQREETRRRNLRFIASAIKLSILLRRKLRRIRERIALRRARNE